MVWEHTRIWMYHRILPRLPTAFGHPSCYHLRGTAITPQMWSDDLRRLRPILPLEAVVEALEAGRAPPAGHVLTFDDGYTEWAELVAPSLRKAGATATFFITTCMRRTAARPHAIDAYYWLLDHAREPVWTVDLGDGETHAGDLRSEEGKRWLVTGSPLKRALIVGDARMQTRLVDAVARAVGVELPEDLPAKIYLREDEWRALASEHTLGAHGITHRPWPLLDDDELERELDGGREALRAATEAKIEFVAYPDGAWDPRVAAALRATGYRAALLAGQEGVAESGALPRWFRSP
ncbi:MAG: polysaccharide deacetylase family protein [Myxococcales bacterium]|nr:polysaccharide deacetylase family protein [Myxococcales bacterium]